MVRHRTSSGPAYDANRGAGSSSWVSWRRESAEGVAGPLSPPHSLKTGLLHAGGTVSRERPIRRASTESVPLALGKTAKFGVAADDK